MIRHIRFVKCFFIDMLSGRDLLLTTQGKFMKLLKLGTRIETNTFKAHLFSSEGGYLSCFK